MKFNWNLPPAKDFVIQQNSDMVIRKTKTACLLKSRTSLVIGKKNSGVKNTAAKMQYFEIRSQILTDI
ncbi:MAG TPA: hypothetical protein PLF16_01685 [Candidatus Staskawiczbacteria bacterium]|nr:hypothetical protein [Candidatus Staskawiczbacteria bacterium]